ncbi:MAG: hypothetical protein A2091_07845 [Desulfuromonadales bacterium GWD2_61_12]|nr:MAG: hypothetical protein A2091_07845 [Desulfuromonadales bacterium GWD2_61_12]
MIFYHSIHVKLNRLVHVLLCLLTRCPRRHASGQIGREGGKTGVSRFIDHENRRMVILLL